MPEANEVFLDIDDEESFRVYESNYRFVSEARAIEGATITPSRNKPQGRHIVVRFREPVTPLERIALQAVLGSDRTRETLSLERLFKGDPAPTLFYEKRA